MITDEDKDGLVTDGRCRERTENFKTEIKSSESRVIAEIKGVRVQIQTFLEHHKEKIDKNEENIEIVDVRTDEAEKKIERLFQWKEDKEKKKDITFKTMTVITSSAVILAMTLGNLSRIITFVIHLVADKP